MIMLITSATNNNIKLLNKLIGQKKYRQQYRQYVVEGEKLLNDAVRFGKQITAVYVAQSSKVIVPDSLLSKVVYVADTVFSSVSDVVNGQGVLAVVNMDSVDVGIGSTGDCLVLDGLQNAGNVGTLLRTALACGFEDVLCSNCVDVYSPKVIRSAMSAHFALRLHTTASIEQAFAKLPTDCYKYACDMNGADIATVNRKSKASIALVLGNEGNGLSAFSCEHCDSIVSLPMKNGLESLNVSVAGSIIMYLLQK